MSSSQEASDDFVGRILAHRDDKRRKVASTMAATRSVHVETENDEALTGEIDHLLDTMVVEMNRQPGYENTRAAIRGGHALLVAGEAGAGKSEAVRTALSRPEFTPGPQGSPLLSIVAPSPFTLGALGNAMARQLGYVTARPLQESMVWPLVNRLIKAKGIRVVHIDEAQHGDEAKGTTAIAVESTLKGLMQQEGWPVWLILSGLPEVLRFFRDDESMRRRVRVVELQDLHFPDDAEIVRGVIMQIAATVPHVDCSLALDGDVIPRLIHSASAQFGILVEYVQDAIVECVQCGDDRLTKVHFADVYASRTGASDHDNPFIRSVFVEIDVRTALYEEELDQKGRPTGRRKPKVRR